MPFCQQIFLASPHNISKWHSGSRGRSVCVCGGGERRGTGSTKQKKKKRTLKNSLTVYETRRFWIIFEASTVQIYLFIVVIVVKQVLRCLTVYILLVWL